MRYAVLIVLCALLCSGCVKHEYTGLEAEISAGTEQGKDSGAPTHKGVYGGLLRFKFDVKK